jgi:hypothetical protein
MMRASTVTGSMAGSMIMALCAGLAMLRWDIYWTALAVWGLILTSFPLFRSSKVQPLVRYFLLFMTLPYLAGLVMGHDGPGIMSISSMWYWPISGMAMFFLCLTTAAVISVYSQMRMNLSFAMVTTFLMFESVAIVQGPVMYYTGLLSNNDDFMADIVLATALGVVLTIVFYTSVKRTRLVQTETATGGGP